MSYWLKAYTEKLKWLHQRSKHLPISVSDTSPDPLEPNREYIVSNYSSKVQFPPENFWQELTWTRHFTESSDIKK